MKKFIAKFDGQELVIATENINELTAALVKMGYSLPDNATVLEHLFVKKAAYCTRDLSILFTDPTKFLG